MISPPFPLLLALSCLFILALAQYQHLGTEIQLVRNAGHIQTFGYIAGNTIPANPSSTTPKMTTPEFNQQFLTQQQQHQQQLQNQPQPQPHRPQHIFRTQQFPNPFGSLGNIGNLGNLGNLGNFGNLGNAASTPLDLGSNLANGFGLGALTNPGQTGGSTFNQLVGIIDGSGDESGTPVVERAHTAAPKLGNSTAVENGYAGTRQAANYTSGSGSSGTVPTITDAKSKLIGTSPTGAGQGTTTPIPISIPTDTTTATQTSSSETPVTPIPTTGTGSGGSWSNSGGSGSGGSGNGGIGTDTPLDPGYNGNGGVINQPEPPSGVGDMNSGFSLTVLMMIVIGCYNWWG